MLKNVFSDKKFIGLKFKEYRKKKSLTQDEVAEKIGIAEKHYGRLERGICLPALDTFFKLVDYLDIPLSDYGIRNITTNDHREMLIKEILISNPQEIGTYLDIIRIIKQNCTFRQDVK